MSTSSNDICVYLFHHHLLTWQLPLSLGVVFSVSLTSPCVLHSYPTTSPPVMPRFSPCQCLMYVIFILTVTCKLAFEYFSFLFILSFSPFSLNFVDLCFSLRKTRFGFWFVGLSKFSYSPNKRWSTWLPIATPCLQGPKKWNIVGWMQSRGKYLRSPVVHCLTWSLDRFCLTKSKINSMPYGDAFQRLVDLITSMRSMHKHHAKNRYIDILPTNLSMPYASRNKLEQVNKFGSVDLDHDVVKALGIVHCANDCTF
jgi:hypothetical protein